MSRGSKMREWKITLTGTKHPRVDGTYVVFISEIDGPTTQGEAIAYAVDECGGYLVSAAEVE
jgi:predicted RNase H-like HicB family nuclease